MTNTTMLRPVYQVSVAGNDITSKIKPRLQSLTITTVRANEADQLDLSFTNTDGKLAMPPKGAEVKVLIGFGNTGVSLQGTYTIDEVEFSGTPDVITVHGRSANVSGALRTRKEVSWDNTTLGDIINAIAGTHSLTPRVGAALASVAVAHIDQTESDMAFLRRLGQRYDAVATVKAHHLIFAPSGLAQSAGGSALNTVTLTRASGDRHRYHAAGRNSYTGVRAHWHDFDAASARSVLAGKSSQVKVLRGNYATRADAQAAASAEMARIKRGAASFDLQCAIGHPDIFPEMPVVLNGWGDEIAATDWIVTEARHNLDGDGGYTTSLQFENKAAASENPAQDDDGSDDEGDA